MKKKKELGITAKKDEFSEWFTQLIIKADLADYSSVSGCLVYKPYSYAIWEKIKEILDKEFKKIGIKNCYFPLFIPEKLLEKEKEHVEGFSPEVAWVIKAGNTDLKEKLAIRPTSEAIMYDSYSKWIRSYRDLPLRLNQWNNVVRWEFKNPIPFLRTREFLWNEGHHVYSNEKELNEDKEKILKIYYNFMKEYMALPGIIGRKTEKEKFAGAKATYTIEVILPNGKAIQGPDYHDDGQNFSKAYNIKYLDEDGKEKYVYQSTYAISTRMLGVMFIVHSDNKGLILPPKLAPIQIVIVPIFFEKSKEKVLKEAKELEKKLKNYNVFLDSRENYKPGFKFNEWELKGVPLRIEIGPKDIEKNQVVIVKRTTNEKRIVKIKNIEKEVKKTLEEIHNELYEKALKLMNESILIAKDFEELKRIINNKKIALTTLCSSEGCEEKIKEETSAKTLNIPEDKKIGNEKCIICNKKASYYVYIGKSY
ncbi:MAG: proline--tRNA ligase [Candidatus Pacearchaeota archaeon]